MFDKFGIECDKEEFFKNPIGVIALMMFDCKYGTTFSLDIEPNKIYKTWHETDFVYEKSEKVFYRLGRSYMTELDLVYPPMKYVYIAEALLKGNIKRAKLLSKSFDVYSNLINFLNSFIILEKIKDTPIPVPKYLELIRVSKMMYYPTVGFKTDLISVVKYTLQDQFFRGSFTQEVLSNARGSTIFDTEILSILDKDDIERINRTSEDLQFRFDDDDYLVVQFMEDGNIVHTVALDEYSPDNESIIVGIEIVDCRKHYDK